MYFRVVAIDDSIVYRQQSEISPVADATDDSKTTIIYYYYYYYQACYTINIRVYLFHNIYFSVFFQCCTL